MLLPVIALFVALQPTSPRQQSFVVNAPASARCRLVRRPTRFAAGSAIGQD
jgi:hypothetical protein